jgi:hypothetical protein
MKGGGICLLVLSVCVCLAAAGHIRLPAAVTAGKHAAAVQGIMTASLPFSVKLCCAGLDIVMVIVQHLQKAASQQARPHHGVPRCAGCTCMTARHRADSVAPHLHLAMVHHSCSSHTRNGTKCLFQR